MKKPISVSIADDKLDQVISKNVPSLNPATINKALLKTILADRATALAVDPFDISLDQYLVSDSKYQTIVAEAFHQNIKPSAGIKAFINKFSNIKVNESSEFSVLDLIRSKNFSEASAKDLSILSSLMYELILQTNFSIIERNQSTSLPDYINLGYEAKVDPAFHEDFTFANPNKISYIIELQMIDNNLYASLKGMPFVYQYRYFIKDKQTFAPKLVKQYSPFVAEGSYVTKENGKDGTLIKMVREVRNQSGKRLESTIIGEDFYPPSPVVRVYGPLKTPLTDSGQTESGNADNVTDNQSETTAEGDSNSQQQDNNDKNNQTSSNQDTNSSKNNQNLGQK
nr:VanW family protein [Bacillus sp. FJAT-49736]